MAVSNLVYISEYGQYGTVWALFMVNMALFGHCLGTVWYTVHAWVHCSCLGPEFSHFHPISQLWDQGVWDPGYREYGTLDMRVYGPWIWDPGMDIPTGWALAIPTRYTHPLYPGYTPAYAPVHACTRTVPGRPCSTL